MIALVDYGLGNIQAFANIYRRLGKEVCAVQTPEQLRQATKIILPGVGAFDWAMNRLNDSGMREVLDDLVLNQKVEVLGVCVGMQIMARSSEEGKLPGLGWIDAEVVKFDRSKFKGRTQLPHMGWNDAAPIASDSIFKNIDNPRYYFLHSYYMVVRNSVDTLSVTDYGGDFTSSVRSGNIYGTQFDPEKSHQWGVDLLRNFSEL